MSHVLNAHTSLFAVDKSRASSLSVKSHAKIEFFVDRDLLYDVDAVARETSVT